MSCPECGDPLMFFEDRIQGCPSCGVLEIDGKVAGDRTPANLAEESQRRGAEFEEGIGGSPSLSQSLVRFYESAYAAGFIHAQASFDSLRKEGRLKRIRTLWERGTVKVSSGNTDVIVSMSQETYTELSQLLVMKKKKKESSSASCHPNKSPSA